MIKGEKKKTVNVFTPLLSSASSSALLSAPLSIPAPLPSSAVILRKDIYKPRAEPKNIKVPAKEKTFNLVQYLYYKWFKTLPL